MCIRIIWDEFKSQSIEDATLIISSLSVIFFDLYQVFSSENCIFAIISIASVCIGLLSFFGLISFAKNFYLAFYLIPMVIFLAGKFQAIGYIIYNGSTSLEANALLSFLTAIFPIIITYLVKFYVWLKNFFEL